MARFAPLGPSDVERAAMLDAAAEARRQAAARQDRARFQCIDCHGPDGEHASSCAFLCVACGQVVEPRTVHWWGRAADCRIEPDRPPRGLVARRTVSIFLPSPDPSTQPRMDHP